MPTKYVHTLLFACPDCHLPVAIKPFQQSRKDGSHWRGVAAGKVSLLWHNIANDRGHGQEALR
jgi:hypothetical protein